jgi:hypothetical protein
MQPGVDDDLVFGSWVAHRATLEHYGIPMIVMPRAMSLHGFSAKRGSIVPLSRAQLYVDGLHLSAAGHWVQALFVAAALLKVPASSQTAAAMVNKHWPLAVQLPPNALPPPRLPLDLLAPFLAKGLTRLDFTQPGTAMDALNSTSIVSGWKWRFAENANGSYAFHDAESVLRIAGPEALARKKLGLSASWRADGAATFTVTLRVRLGLLRLGYLRSYNGRADVTLELHSERPEWNTSHILNGTWDREVSVFTTKTLDLRPTICPRLTSNTSSERMPCNAVAAESIVEARFKLLSSVQPGGGDFTIFSICSY